MMRSKYSEDEVKEMIRESMIALNKEDAMHCAPVHSLLEILPMRKAEDLKELARFVGIKYISKYRKADLAAKIAEEMTRPEVLELILYGMDYERWMFFLFVSEEDKYVADILPLDLYNPAQTFGLMQLFYHDEKLILVVPDEVKEALEKLDEDDFIAFKSFSEDVLRYSCAAAHLYGVLPVAVLTDILSEEYPELNVPEVLVTLNNMEARMLDFRLFEQNVVHRFFENDRGEVHGESVQAMLENRSGRPRYRPSLDEFLQYADPDHTEAYDECENLEESLFSLVEDAEDLGDLIDDIAFACRVDSSVSDILSIVADYGVELDDERGAEEVVKAIIALKNRSRSWLLFGHSPEELRKAGSLGETSKGGVSGAAGGSKIVPLFEHRPTESIKVGRNDQCPCGSGKKYKNCCGK